MTKNLVLRLLFAALFLLGPRLFGQGITKAAIGGFVYDKGGKPVGNATVTITHDPSGTKTTTTTRANGQYNASGLRVGGPYTVSATADGYRGETRSDIFL